MRITIAADTTVEIDTLLEQQNLNFYPDPPLGGVEPSAEVVNGIASRVMVLVMAPVAGWDDITHDEPLLDATTGTVHVTFTNGHVGEERTFNVLFWDPHTSVCPVNAHTYHVPFEA